MTERPALDVEMSYTITANGVDAVTFDIPDGTRVFTVSLDERAASADGSTSFVDDVADGDDTYTFTSRRRGRWELAVDTRRQCQPVADATGLRLGSRRPARERVLGQCDGTTIGNQFHGSDAHQSGRVRCLITSATSC